MQPRERWTLRDQVGFVIRGTFVKRYHNRVTVMEDTVGRHSNLVTIFCWYLSGNKASPQLLMAAATHDTAEGVVSDPSAPVKAQPGVKEAINKLEVSVHEAFGFTRFEDIINPDEKVILSLADKLEGLAFSLHEFRGLSNRRMYGVARRYREYIDHMIDEMGVSELAKRAINLRNAIHDYFDHQDKDEEDICKL